MDDLSAGGWLLLIMVLLLVGWGGFIAWSGGLGKAFLQAWGLRGARLFKKPATVVAKPQAQRSHGAPNGAHSPAGAPPKAHGGVQAHRSGKRRSAKH